jgi:hypothetical protein
LFGWFVRPSSSGYPRSSPPGLLRKHPSRRAGRSLDRAPHRPEDEGQRAIAATVGEPERRPSGQRGGPTGSPRSPSPLVRAVGISSSQPSRAASTGSAASTITMAARGIQVKGALVMTVSRRGGERRLAHAPPAARGGSASPGYQKAARLVSTAAFTADPKRSATFTARNRFDPVAKVWGPAVARFQRLGA